MFDAVPADRGSRLLSGWRRVRHHRRVEDVMGRAWREAVREISIDGSGSVEARDRAVEIVVSKIRELLQMLDGSQGDAAFDTLYNLTLGITRAFGDEAQPDKPGRAAVLELMSFLVNLTNDWAPIAADALRTDDAVARTYAAKLLRELADVPPLARAARQWASWHPDVEVRAELRTRRSSLRR